MRGFRASIELFYSEKKAFKSLEFSSIRPMLAD